MSAILSSKKKKKGGEFLLDFSLISYTSAVIFL